MTYFLASNPIIYERRRLNPANAFVNLLKEHLPSKFSAFSVCSDPNNNTSADQYAADVEMTFEAEGMTSEKYVMLDNRTANQASDLVAEADLVFLTGEHMPIQNAFLNSVSIRELLQSGDKLAIGSSAGSINAAEFVYAQPEEAGEAVPKDYQRSLAGSGITRVQLIPRCREAKHHMPDGLRVFEDITYPGGNDRCFYAIYDGNFLCGNGTVEIIYGEVYCIKNGALLQTNAENETYQFGKWV